MYKRHQNNNVPWKLQKSVGAHLHDGEEDLEGDPVVSSVLHHQLFHLAFSRVLIKNV